MLLEEDVKNQDTKVNKETEVGNNKRLKTNRHLTKQHDR